MGMVFLASLALGVFLSALPSAFGVYLLIRQNRSAGSRQILLSLLVSVVCVYVFIWAVNFSDWWTEIKKLPSSEQAGACIPLAFAFGFVPGVALAGAVYASVVYNGLSTKIERG